jgi:hypothetical protein
VSDINKNNKMKIYDSILDYELFKQRPLPVPYGKITTMGGLDKYVRECINADLNPKPEEAFTFELYSNDFNHIRCLMYLGNWSADFQVYSKRYAEYEEYTQDQVSRILEDNSIEIQELIATEKYEIEKAFGEWKAERGITTGW